MCKHSYICFSGALILWTSGAFLPLYRWSPIELSSFHSFLITLSFGPWWWFFLSFTSIVECKQWNCCWLIEIMLTPQLASKALSYSWNKQLFQVFRLIRSTFELLPHHYHKISHRSYIKWKTIMSSKFCLELHFEGV